MPLSKNLPNLLGQSIASLSELALPDIGPLSRAFISILNLRAGKS